MSNNEPVKPAKMKTLVMLIMASAVVTSVLAFGAAALLVDIMQKKNEAKNTFFPVAEIDDNTYDPEVWGRNFPFQYDQYKRTVDMVRTKHGGSESIPRTPSDKDPRAFVSQSKLEEEKRLVKMWAGYAFAIDFREERGHAFMLTDQMYTGRHAKPQPATCLNCHASTYPIYKKLGDGDIMAGFTAMNKLPYFEAAKLAEHSVACIDCHTPGTMALRITRPAFIEGIAAYKKNKQGVENYDVNKMATRQEMRSFVCGQCHVEYYFKGDEKRLVFPWSKGFAGDNALAVYDEAGFKDWVHAETGAGCLKAQHPEFETWNMGIHARSGVSCADCHMPYMRVGAMKISDHHVNSPYLKIQRSCQTCHHIPEEDLKERIDNIQNKTVEMKEMAMSALMELIDDCVAAKADSMPASKLDAALDMQRKATFLFDYVEAENSTGFHAPQESARILMQSLNYSRKGQNILKAE